jgi:hypothetical protein
VQRSATRKATKARLAALPLTKALFPLPLLREAQGEGTLQDLASPFGKIAHFKKNAVFVFFV